ncbi:MAG: MraY family glycosyltransferase [Acidiferrobacterales bacterium]
MPALVILLVTAVCFAISAGLTRRFCNPASRLHILDHPNERSLHTRPTPRSGGVAIFSAIVVGMAGLAWRFPDLSRLPWIVSGMALIAVVSFVDDRRRLPVAARMLAHLLGAGVLLRGGYSLRDVAVAGLVLSLPGWLGIGISLLFVMWMVNLYNFMDGMDGFSGGMAMIGFGGFAALGWMSGNDLFCGTSVAIAAAAAGFLAYNFPPARIFMGDVGSSTLGFLVAALSLWGVRDGIFSIWTAVLVFSPFVADATATLLRRLVRGEKVWQAHKTHYYQRLVQLGWGHRKTVLWEYALMVGCVGSALWVKLRLPAVQAGVLLVWGVVYVSLMFFVHHLERRRKQIA